MYVLRSVWQSCKVDPILQSGEKRDAAMVSTGVCITLTTANS